MFSAVASFDETLSFSIDLKTDFMLNTMLKYRYIFNIIQHCPAFWQFIKLNTLV